MQARKEEMKQRISQELAVANAQTLINVSSRFEIFSWTGWCGGGPTVWSSE